MDDNYSITTIRFTDSDGDYVYLESTYPDHDGDMRVTSCYRINEAMDLSGMNDESIFSIYQSFQSYYEDEACEVVRITVKTTVENLFEDNDEYREARQQVALKKLNEHDIKVLNLTNLAVYIKTKYHNA